MTAALALAIAPETAPSTALRERVQVLESRPGVREMLLVTEARAETVDAPHAVIVLGGGGGGFAVTSRDGTLRVHGGLSVAQRQRLARAIGGSVVALSPPSDHPVMDRGWRLSHDHVIDIGRAVAWTRAQCPLAHTWVLGMDNGALSAAVATASLDDVAGAVLLACVDDALERAPRAERKRILAVRPRDDGGAANPPRVPADGRETIVTVHDERHVRQDGAHGRATNGAPFNGKEYQVVDVVARWILSGAAPAEIR